MEYSEDLSLWSASLVICLLFFTPICRSLDPPCITDLPFFIYNQDSAIQNKTPGFSGASRCYILVSSCCLHCTHRTQCKVNHVSPLMFYSWLKDNVAQTLCLLCCLCNKKYKKPAFHWLPMSSIRPFTKNPDMVVRVLTCLQHQWECPLFQVSHSPTFVNSFNSSFYLSS